MSTKGPSNTSQHIREVVQHNVVEVYGLPNPGEPWQRRDVDLDSGTFQKLNHADAIECVESGREKQNVWTVTEQAAAIARERMEDMDRFACCGSRGVTNTGDGLECKHCGADISEAEYRRVLG